MDIQEKPNRFHVQRLAGKNAPSFLDWITLNQKFLEVLQLKECSLVIMKFLQKTS